jgi:putative sterol carrier protein
MNSVKEFFDKLPEKVSPESIEGMETVFHFNFSGEENAVHTVKIKDQKLQINEGLEGEPECVISGKSESFLQVLNGQLNPMMALMTGKLKVSNTGAMMKYAKIFGVL